VPRPNCTVESLPRHRSGVLGIQFDSQATASLPPHSHLRLILLHHSSTPPSRTVQQPIPAVIAQQALLGLLSRAASQLLLTGEGLMGYSLAEPQLCLGRLASLVGSSNSDIPPTPIFPNNYHARYYNTFYICIYILIDLLSPLSFKLCDAWL
jgi:hypothetical protein